MRITTYCGIAMLLLAGGASTASAQIGNSVDITYLKPGPNQGQVRVTGKGTPGAGWGVYYMRLEVGNYETRPHPTDPTRTVTVFVLAVPGTGDQMTNPLSRTFSGLTPGRTYIARATATFRSTTNPNESKVLQTEQGFTAP